MKLFEVVMMVVYKICGCMIKNGTSGNQSAGDMGTKEKTSFSVFYNIETVDRNNQ